MFSANQTTEIVACILQMKLMMKFYLCLHNISEICNLFSRVVMKNCFWCYFRQLFIAEVQRPEGAGDP